MMATLSLVQPDMTVSSILGNIGDSCSPCRQMNAPNPWQYPLRVERAGKVRRKLARISYSGIFFEASTGSLAVLPLISNILRTCWYGPSWTSAAKPEKTVSFPDSKISVENNFADPDNTVCAFADSATADSPKLTFLGSSRNPLMEFLNYFRGVYWCLSSRFW